MTPLDQPGVTAFICVTCRGAGGDDERPGQVLLDAVMTRLQARADCNVTVTAVECLSVCKRPCTIALMAPGKWTYVVGDLDPETHTDDVIAMAVRYGLTDNGIVPWRERPQSFRKGAVARIPPLGYSHQA
jgi:predicted metal-binding protein